MDDLFAGDTSNGIDDDEDVMTAGDVLQKLEEVWLNEKFAPDLLESQSPLVECMLEQIAEMEGNIARARSQDFKIHIHRMEIDRIRYIISSYLRIRLHKIEKYTKSILQAESNGADKLSPEEHQYAKEYAESTDAHLKGLALQHMPQNLQNLDPKFTNKHPPLDSYVFLRVNEETQGVMVEDETAESGEDILDLEKGTQHIMRYRPIQDLVASGAVSLV